MLLEKSFKNPVITLGNFDGVHLGHRKLFRQVVQKAKKIDGTAMVFSFQPHPIKVLRPNVELKLINTYEEKTRLIEASCIDVMLTPSFTPELAAMPAEKFIEQVLVERIGVRHIVVGYDYHFGRQRKGNAQLLAHFGDKHGFSVEVLSPVAENGIIYSSSRIREMIACGEVDQAVSLLGRHFNLEGTVVHGEKRGRALGFPTANLETEKELLPAAGVYAVKVCHGHQLYDGVLNIGCKPTFKSVAQTIEVHLLNFSGDLYGQTVRVYFFQRLRAEKKFAGIDLLTKAIQEDVATARRHLNGAKLIHYRDDTAGHFPPDKLAICQNWA
jgi:riboflavin kinase/FMN adenylyltransferase